MTRDIKYLVLALAMATAGAVSPPTLRGVKDAETVGDIVTPHSTKMFPTTVVVGAWDLTDWQNEGDTEIPAPEERVVDDVLIHPNRYDVPMYAGPPAYRAGAYDVALLHLKEPSSLDTVTIAQSAPAVGTPVEVMGWGNDKVSPPPRYPVKLQIVEVCVLNDAKCSKVARATRRTRPSSFVCSPSQWSE